MKAIGLFRPSAFALLAVGLLLASATQAQTTTSRRTTADGRPLASSLPTAQKRLQMKPLAFEELAKHRGARIELTTIHGVLREGHVDGVQGQTLRLRVAAGLGYAVVNVERANIREVRMMQ